MSTSIQDVHAVFLAFANYGRSVETAVKTIDGKSFAKLCKDAGIIKRPSFTVTDCDLLFARIKDKGERRITFKQFRVGMNGMAEKRGMALAEIASMIVKVGGPTANATTKAEYNKFHDNKNYYTGVHKNGGPTNVDAPSDLSHLVNRSPGAGGTPGQGAKPRGAMAF